MSTRLPPLKMLDRVVGVCPKHGIVYEHRSLPVPLHPECSKSLDGQYEQTCGKTLTYTAREAE